MARPRSFEIRTPRLRIRTLARRDITEFTRYRNLPEVARYQDWPLPYTRDLAHELVDEMESLTEPTSGEWVQLALDEDGDLVGDLAIWLDDTGALAMVGYTLSPEHQGRGLATEAVSAAIDWLFDIRRCHRIAATIDPANVPSARVLERCGFEHDGTARSAALVRGAWCDDTRYSILPADRASWNRRPVHHPENVSLVEVTPDNVRTICGLSVAPSQRAFVAGVAESIADATHPEVVDGAPVVPWYRGILADGEHVGFVMIARRTTCHPVTYLWRLLVDHRHQGRGIGVRALAALARVLAEDGESELELSFVDARGGPERFYRGLGFVRTGAVEPGSGEVIARAALADIIDRATRVVGS